jgi:hypothetical protein
VRSQRVVPARRGRGVVAEQIGRDEREVLRHPRRHRLPRLRRVGDPVQQQQYGTVPGAAVGHAVSMERDLVRLEDLPCHAADDGAQRPRSALPPRAGQSADPLTRSSHACVRRGVPCWYGESPIGGSSRHAQRPITVRTPLGATAAAAADMERGPAAKPTPRRRAPRRRRAPTSRATLAARPHRPLSAVRHRTSFRACRRSGPVSPRVARSAARRNPPAPTPDHA